MLLSLPKTNTCKSCIKATNIREIPVIMLFDVFALNLNCSEYIVRLKTLCNSIETAKNTQDQRL